MLIRKQNFDFLLITFFSLRPEHYLGEIMSTTFTSLSSFLITKDKISEIEDKLEKLKQFSENDYPFQIQDKVNSTLALLKDCCEKSRICYEMCNELQVLESYSEHKDKNKVRLVLEKHNSVENLLQESLSELKHFRKKLCHCGDYLKEIQDEYIRTEELVCNKCEGRGYLLKTKYVRERGSSPQPYTESITCDRCDGTGKTLLDSEPRKELSEFIQATKPIQTKFNIYIKTLENYLTNYEVPSLEGYNDIELIFPEENPESKKRQQALSEFN